MLRIYLLLLVLASSSLAALTVNSGNLGYSADTPSTIYITGSGFSGSSATAYTESTWYVSSVTFSPSFSCGSISATDSQVACANPSSPSTVGSLSVVVCVDNEWYNTKTDASGVTTTCTSSVTIGYIYPYLTPPSSIPLLSGPTLPSITFSGYGFGTSATPCAVYLSNSALCTVQTSGYSGTSFTCTFTKLPQIAGNLNAYAVCRGYTSNTIVPTGFRPALTTLSTVYYLTSPPSQQVLTLYGSSLYGTPISSSWYSSPTETAYATPLDCTSFNLYYSSGYFTCTIATNSLPPHAGEAWLKITQAGVQQLSWTKVAHFAPAVVDTTDMTTVAPASLTSLAIKGYGFGTALNAVSVTTYSSSQSLTAPDCSVTFVNNTYITCTLASAFEQYGPVWVLVNYYTYSGTVTSNWVITNYIKPVITASSASWSASSSGLTVYGQAFGATTYSLSIRLSSGAATVNALGAHGSSANILFSSTPMCGPLTAQICSSSYCSDWTQIATVVPFVSSTGNPVIVSSTQTLFTINGFGFSNVTSDLKAQLSLLSATNTSLQTVNCTATNASILSFSCSIPSTSWLQSGFIRSSVTCGMQTAPNAVTHSVVTGLVVHPSLEKPIDQRTNSFYVYGANLGTNVASINVFLQPTGICQPVVVQDSSVLCTVSGGLTLGMLNISVQRLDSAEPQTPFVWARNVILPSPTIPAAAGRILNRRATKITINGNDLSSNPNAIFSFSPAMTSTVNFINGTTASLTLNNINGINGATLGVLSLETNSYVYSFYLSGSATPIYTLVDSPILYPTPQSELISSSPYVDFYGANLDIYNTSVTLKYRARYQSNNNIALEYPVPSSIVFINSTYALLNITSPIPLDDSSSLSHTLVADVFSGGGPSTGEAVIRFVTPPPSISESSANLSKTATSLTLTASGLGENINELQVQLLPSGTCTIRQLDSNSIVCDNVEGLQIGTLTAIVLRRGAPSLPQGIATVVEPIKVLNSTFTTISKSQTIQRSFAFDTEYIPDQQLTGLLVYARLEFVIDNEGYVGVTINEATNTRLNISLTPVLSGNIFVKFTTFGGNCSEVAIAYAANDPYLSSVSVLQAAVAVNAQLLTVHGSDFKTNAPTALTVYSYSGTNPPDVVMLNTLGERHNCTTKSVAATSLTCAVEPPLNLTSTQGFLWGWLVMDGTLVAPGRVTFGGFTSAPTSINTDFLISQTVNSIQLKGTGISPYDISVVLLDSNQDPITTSKCTFDSLRGISVANGQSQFYCNNDGILPIGELFGHVITAGAVTTFRIGQVVAAATVTANPSYLRAANAQELQISGSNFVVSPNHAANTVVLNGSINCDMISATSTQLICKPVRDLPVGDLYATLSVLGGTALPPQAKKRIVNNNSFLIGHVVAAPKLVPVDQSGAVLDSTASQITLTGSNFGALPSDNVVTFNIPGTEVRPECAAITSSDASTIICNINNLDKITNNVVMKAQVDVYGGSTGMIDVVTVQSSTSSNIVAGVASGVPIGLVVIAGVVILIVFLLRRRRQQRLKDMLHKKASKTGKAYAEMDNMHLTTARQVLQEWLVPLDDIEFGDQVGEGSFGKVFVGKFRGQKVAIKEASLTDPAIREEFYREAKLMCSIRPHKNVVQVLGVAVEDSSDKCFIVMDYLYGSLDKIVYDSDNRQKMSTSDYVRYARQIAAGMAHLASLGIVHRDLASRNILLSKKNEAKISDFGMSRTLNENQSAGKTASTVGPIRWMSPEALGQNYSEKSDVWAFGALLVEMITGDQPFGETQDMIEVALAVRDQGKYPPFPLDVIPAFNSICEACFRPDPAQRPTFAELVAMLGNDD